MNRFNDAFNRLAGVFIRKYPRLDMGEGKAVLTLSFDCDFRKDCLALPDLIGILSQYSFLASFACVGKWIEKYPSQHALIVDENHEIINHTYSHPDNEESNPKQRFNLLSKQQKKEEIIKCHQASSSVLGYEPRGFRTPHFGRQHTADIYDILSELGYAYSSSTSAYLCTSQGLPFISKNRIWEFPLTNCPRHPRTIFDSWHCFTHPEALHKHEGEFLNLFKELIDNAIIHQSYINIYFDPSEMVKRKSLRLLLDYILKVRNELLILTYRQMLEKCARINV